MVSVEFIDAEGNVFHNARNHFRVPKTTREHKRRKPASSSWSLRRPAMIALVASAGAGAGAGWLPRNRGPVGATTAVAGRNKNFGGRGPVTILLKGTTSNRNRFERESYKGLLNRASRQGGGSWFRSSSLYRHAPPRNDDNNNNNDKNRENGGIGRRRRKNNGTGARTEAPYHPIWRAGVPYATSMAGLLAMYAGRKRIVRAALRGMAASVRCIGARAVRAVRTLARRYPVSMPTALLVLLGFSPRLLKYYPLSVPTGLVLGLVAYESATRRAVGNGRENDHPCG